MAFDELGNLFSGSDVVVIVPVKTFHLLIQPESDLFKHQVGVGIFAGMLAALHYIAVDFIYVGEIEITT